MERNILKNGQRIRLFEQGVGRDDTPIHFTIQSCVGMGASSVAYEARSDAGLPVVLKKLEPSAQRLELSSYEELEARFVSAHRRQLEFVNRPDISNITSALTGFYRDGYGVPWVSVRGTFSKAYSRIASQKAPAENIRLIRLLAEGVLAFHRAGYLMLDITPDNILFIEELGVSAVSFFDLDSFVSKAEIASALEQGEAVTLLSTTPYAAPELSGDGYGADLSRINESCDIYSIGAALYYALFSKPPREENSLLSWKNSIPGKAYDFSGLDWGEGCPPDIETQHQLNRILQKTLCIEQTGRFGCCEELMAALDELLSLQKPRRLRLKKNTPQPVKSFTGRRGELDRLARWLREGSGSIFISGMAGMGKSELAFSAAGNLSEEFDFYYAPYTLSLKDTLLNIPTEELPEELEGADKREARFAAILDFFSRQERKSVLIIDNFDAQNDKNTLELINDVDFAALSGLPIGLIFTSRCDFGAKNALVLGSLGDRELLKFCRSRLPNTDDREIEKLIACLGGHTLLVDIASRCLKLSKGGLSVAELCHKLESKGTANDKNKDTEAVLAKLRKLFDAFGMGFEERRMLSFFSLVPVGGVSSSLLSRIVSAEQWRALEKLSEGGWLRHDIERERWSLHPLLESMCLSHKRLCPTKPALEKILASLSEIERSGAVTELEARRETDAIYSGYMRKARDVKYGRVWIPVLTAILAAFAVALFFIARQPQNIEKETFESAEISLVIRPNTAVTDEEFIADSQAIGERLEVLAGKELSYEVSAEDMEIYARLPLKLIMERGCDLGYILDNWLLFDGQLCSIDQRENSMAGGEVNYVVLHPEKSDFSISTESLLYEAPGGNEIFIPEGMPHLVYSPSDEVYRLIKDMQGSAAAPLLGSGTIMPSVLETDGSIAFVNSELCTESLLWAIVHAYTHEPLAGTYYYDYEVSPTAIWEVPEEGQRTGIYQCSAGEMGDNTVTAIYTSYDSREMSEYSFEENKAVFRARLDALGLDYAIGTVTEDERSIAIMLPADKVSVEHLELLAAYDLKIGSYADKEPWVMGLVDPYKAEIFSTDSGAYGLRLYCLDDSYENENYDKFLRCVEALGTEDIFLYADESETSAYMLRGSYDVGDGKAGILSFDEYWYCGKNELGDEELGLLRLMQKIVNNPRLSSYDLLHYNFSAEDGSFGVQRSTPEDQKVSDWLDEMEKLCPTVKAYHRVDGGIQIFLGLETGPDFIEKGFEMTETILESYDFLSGSYPYVYVDFNSRFEKDLYRVCVNIWHDPFYSMEDEIDGEVIEPGCIVFNGVCRGDNSASCYDEFVECYRQAELYRFSRTEKWGVDPRQSCQMYEAYSDIQYCIYD